jgi:hypothetical protein
MSLRLQRTLVAVLIIVGVLIVGFFGFRTLHAFREVKGHRPPHPPFSPEDTVFQTDVELIREWMTIPFIARTYHVPPKALFDAVGVSPKENTEKSLQQLNQEFFPGEDGIVMTKIKAAVLANQPPIAPTSSDASAPPSAP